MACRRPKFIPSDLSRGSPSGSDCPPLARNFCILHSHFCIPDEGHGPGLSHKLNCAGKAKPPQRSQQKSVNSWDRPHHGLVSISTIGKFSQVRGRILVLQITGSASVGSSAYRFICAKSRSGRRWSRLWRKHWRYLRAGLNMPETEPHIITNDLKYVNMWERPLENGRSAKLGNAFFFI